MAKFELPIYGENDEVMKIYETEHCPWDIYIQAATLNDEKSEMTTKEQFERIGEIIKSVFVGMSDDELRRADASDVMNTFYQLYNSGLKIKNA